MKIENVSKSEKKADKFIVSFDDDSNIKVSASQIADYGLYSGRELSDNDYNELKNVIGLVAAKTRALRILGNRSLSAREMERRLASKGESEETAQATVEWLKENGFINDSEYASSIVKHYTGKGYGPARIKDEMFRRGIPREISDEAVNSFDDDAKEDAALKYICQKLKGSREKEEIRSVTGALCRRGFSYDDARAAVRKYIERIEETGGSDDAEQTE